MFEEIESLSKVLKEQDERPNVLSLEKFRRYAPIFQKQDPNKPLTARERQDLIDLSNEYYKLINPYNITHIVKSEKDPTIVLRLPQIFTRVRPLTQNEKNDVLVSRNQKLTMAAGAPPRLQAEAFHGMATALLNEQQNNADVVKTAQSDYKEVMDEFLVAYGKMPSQDPAAETPVIQNEEWEFD